MARDWESIFRNWASPPGKTEQERCENAERVIKNAIAASPQLNKRNIKVFTQGSYRNNTNVRQDSDVDICVRLNSTFFTRYPEGTSRENFGNIKGSITYSEFRNKVVSALYGYFDHSSVKEGSKAIEIRANTYRVNADVVPTLEYRYYTGKYNSDGSHHYLSGVKFICNDGTKIINWPEQHYTNGVSKNNTTGRRYKAMVRILKKLCNEMTDDGIAAARPIPGFLNECLVWNVPDSNFGNNSYINDVRNFLAHLFNNTISEEKCLEWVEVSELKYLFRWPQKWTWQQAHSFISEAWDYLGFK